MVHGMRHSEPERVTPKLLAELRRITPYAPEHLPREIGLIEAFRRRNPKLTQVTCSELYGGEGGIRTPGTLASSTDFELPEGTPVPKLSNE